MNLKSRGGPLYRRLSLPIATAVTLFLIASTAPTVENVLAQSKARSRQKTNKPSSKASQPATGQIPDSEIDDDTWAGLASEKLDLLTSKEAPELMDALDKAPEIDYQIENDPDCPVSVASARIKGLRVDWIFQPGEPGGLPGGVPEGLPAGVPAPPVDPVDAGDRYLIIKDSVTLKNKTNQPIAGLSLERGPFWPVAIQPNSTVTHVFANRYSVYWGRPSIKVVGVDFKNGKVWGESYRVPPPPPPAPPPRAMPQAPVVSPPEIGLIRRSEQELRETAVSSLDLSKEQVVKGTGGAATVQLIIAPTGKVACAIYLSGPESMRQPVIEAAQGWRFKPTPGLAVAGVVTIHLK